AGPARPHGPRDRLHRRDPARDPPLEQERLSLERLRSRHVRGALSMNVRSTRTRILGWLGPRPRLAHGLALVASVLVASLVLAAPRAQEQEPDDGEETQAVGRRAFVENCLICHAEGMTSRLRLTAKQWTAELDKMIGWGAPVPPEHKAALLAYLTK